MSPTNSPEAGNLGAKDDDAGSEIDMSMPAPSTGLATIVALADAERLTTRIQLRLGTIADNVESVRSLIEQARAANVHEVLGYRSWTEYVAERFGGLLARIGKAERLSIVELLSGQGMSTRAIATVVGVSKDTVSRDLRPGVSNETPEHLLDDLDQCRAMAAGTDEEFEAAITEARADDDLPRENVVAKITAGNVIGIDGKSYTRPAPTAPRRRALPDQARDAGWDLRKSSHRIGRILADDRLGDNYEHVSRVLRRHLQDAQSILRDGLDLLPRDDSAFTDPYLAAVDDLGQAVERFERIDRAKLAASRYLEAKPVPLQHLAQLRTALQQVADDLGEWWS